MPAAASLRPAPSAPRTDHRLDPIRAKVDRGERLSLAEGELLFATPDIWSVLELADSVRRRLHGNTAFYNINRHLNYSNVCALSCKFCEFYRKKDEEGSYTRDMAYVREETKKAVEAGATEMHVVGGLHPYLPFSYYTDLISTIRESAASCSSPAPSGGGVTQVFERDGGGEPAVTSSLHIKAFTAVEIVHLAKIAKVYKQDDRRAGIRWVLQELKNAGLGSLPGGGAEVFDDRVHDEAYKGKIRSDVWLDVHRTAHELGLNTNATLLYGHIETRHDRLVHMDMLRRAQDEALARMGYKGTEARWHDGTKETRHTPTMNESSSESSRFEGHLGYQGEDSSDTPVITLTKPGTPLPEHIAFSSSSPSSLPRSLAPLLPTIAHSPIPSASPSGYYQTIIPLPFFPDGCDLEHLPGPSGLENYRTLAVARLMLDNFPHVKAFWIMQTLPMAQVMLQSGADDLDGTVVWYDITKMAQGGGAESHGTHQETSVWTLQKAIRDAGFVPVERDTLYRRITRDGKRWSIAR